MHPTIYVRPAMSKTSRMFKIDIEGLSFGRIVKKYIMNNVKDGSFGTACRREHGSYKFYNNKYETSSKF